MLLAMHYFTLAAIGHISPSVKQPHRGFYHIFGLKKSSFPIPERTRPVGLHMQGAGPFPPLGVFSQWFLNFTQIFFKNLKFP